MSEDISGGKKLSRLYAALQEALQLPASEGLEYLNNVFSGDEDASLRAEVLEMYHGYHDDVPTVGVKPGKAHSGNDPALQLPSKIGPYQIASCLGEGGMGVVYLGKRDNPQRTVAVKVLKAGMLFPLLKDRFADECSMLAKMNHPAVATLYDSGITHHEFPWFAMEYVEGLPITMYCQQRELPFAELLRLFLQVCDGMEAIHRKGIFHRDIKPSNVLIAEDELGHPLVKVIDFGIAKMTEIKSGDHVPLTVTGSTLGTPEYMAPESLAGGTDTDGIQVDVYSLGVLLYEMLTDRVPFPLISPSGGASGSGKQPKNGQREYLRRVQVELPPLPSSLSRYSRNGLLKDLDAVVLKALAKNPGERYSLVEALRSDVLAVLEHRPVMARSINTGYIIKKFVRRHWKPVVLAAMFVLTLTAAAIVSFQQMLKAKTLQVAAEERTRAAQISKDFILHTIKNADPYNNHRDPPVSEVLLATHRDVEAELSELPGAKLEIHLFLAEAFLRLGKHFDAEIHACRAEELAEELEDKESYTQAVFLHGRIALDMQELYAAQSLLERVYEHAKGDSQQRAKVLTYWAHCERRMENLDFAQVLYEIALVEAGLEFGDQSREYLRALQGLASTFRDQESFEWALMIYDEVLWVQEQVLAGGHLSQANTYQSVGNTYRLMGQHDEARASYAAALGIRAATLGEFHPETLRLRLHIQFTLLLTKRYQNVEEYSEKWAPALEHHLGMDHRYTQDFLVNYTEVLKVQGNWAKVVSVRSRLFQYFQENLGSLHLKTIRHQNNLARALYAEGKLNEAERHVTAALKTKQSLLGYNHPSTKRSEQLLQLIRKKQQQKQKDP